MRPSLTEQCATVVPVRKVLTQFLVKLKSSSIPTNCTSGLLPMPHKHIRFSLGCGCGSTRPRTTLAMTCPIMRPWIRLRSETIAEPTYLVGLQTTARVSLTLGLVQIQTGGIVIRNGAVPATAAARRGTIPPQPCQPASCTRAGEMILCD